MNIVSLLMKVGGLEVFVRGLIFLSNILLARGLTPDDFAMFVFIWSLVQGLWLITESGTTVSGMREASKGNANIAILYQELVTIRLFHAIIVIAIFSFVVLFLPWDEAKKTMAILCASYIVFYAPYADWLARGLEKVYWLALGRVAYGLTCLSVSIIVLVSPLDWFAFVMFPFAALLGSWVMLANAKGLISLVNLSHKELFGCWRRIVSKSWIYTFGGMLTITLQFLPLWWLDFHHNTNALKFFAPAFNLLFVISNVLSIVSLVFIPRMTRHMNAGSRKFVTTGRWYFYAVVAVSIISVSVFYFLSGDILLLFYGEAYRQSAVILHLLSPLAMLFAFQYVFGSFVTASGKQWLYCVALCFALITQFGLLLLFKESYSMIVVACISLIGSFSVLVVGLAVISFYIAKPYGVGIIHD